MVNIFIANLDWSITSEDLNTTFSSFGTVHYAHVVYEKESRKSRGYGYVEMESADAAIAAIEALNGMEINGRAIDVKIASPKSNRPKKEDKPVETRKPFNKQGGRSFNNQGGNRPYNNNNGERRYNNNQGGERRYNNNSGERSYTPRDNNSGERSYTPRDNNSGERRYTPRDNNASGERRYTPRENSDRPYTPREYSGEQRAYTPREGQDRFPRTGDSESTFTSKPVSDENTTSSSEEGEVKRELRPRRNKQ